MEEVTASPEEAATAGVAREAAHGADAGPEPAYSEAVDTDEEAEDSSSPDLHLDDSLAVPTGTGPTMYDARLLGKRVQLQAGVAEGDTVILAENGSTGSRILCKSLRNASQ